MDFNFTEGIFSGKRAQFSKIQQQTQFGMSLHF
uniref:Uncharacterized protein n=1 Tax=Rhizophora mucronata TaxID=61149 RepID=A0A2P2MXY8_RHIMU